MERSVAVRRWLGVGVGVLALGALSGCGGTMGFAPEPTGGVNVSNLLAFNTLHPTPAPAKVVAEERYECPTIEVMDGTASSRVYAGADQSNNNVKYQYSMGDVVRECAHVGDQITIKVGVSGRVLLGPAGSPGAFTAPVRIAIRSEKTQKALTSKFYSVPVTVAPGETQADFSIVSDPLAVPFVSGDSDYTVVVGFDTKGGDTTPKTAHPKRHQRG